MQANACKCNCTKIPILVDKTTVITVRRSSWLLDFRLETRKFQNALSILLGRALKCVHSVHSEGTARRRRTRRRWGGCWALASCRKKRITGHPGPVLLQNLRLFSDPLIHCYSVIVYLQYIHYLVHFSSPLQDGLHFPDSWRKKMNNVENEAPIGL